VSEGKENQLQMLKGRLQMIESMQKNLALDKEKGLDVNDPDYLQKLRQRAMRENMENMLATLSKSPNPEHKAQIGVLREGIANIDKMLSMSPHEQAVDFLKTQVNQMENNVTMMTEQLTALSTSTDRYKEEKALQMGHSLFITKSVITKLKSVLGSTDIKFKSPHDVNDLRVEATKSALLARIKQLQGENKPEKYSQSIAMLKAKYQQLLSGGGECTHAHGHGGGGHGHSHGGGSGHGHSHGGGSHSGHGHSHGGGSHGSHGHSHGGGDEHDDCDEDDEDDHDDHGHSHGAHAHSHGGSDEHDCDEEDHGHSHAHGGHGHSH